MIWMAILGYIIWKELITDKKVSDQNRKGLNNINYM